ncbi:hypothetical protein BLNAU_21984 [Blattamonas nauphoetae]|uniref:Uncharacterized protein n=1 Tax=Blattamonas nauphoetae TaxID=2049346 RepID=A0ABQ9WUE8_9EUKA|nr:hypothetical protein BLNAU_21984 [Blattamonas nauphoetae]
MQSKGDRQISITLINLMHTSGISYQVVDVNTASQGAKEVVLTAANHCQTTSCSPIATSKPVNQPSKPSQKSKPQISRYQSTSSKKGRTMQVEKQLDGMVGFGMVMRTLVQTRFWSE